MQVLMLLSLALRNLLKFKAVYFLDYRVHLLDVILNSFLISFLLLSILIQTIALPYTFNTLYLLFFTSVLFSMAISYLHYFYRASALEKFYGNFSQIREDLDFSMNTIIDYLCSTSKRDGVRVKGLIQLVVSQTECQAA